MADVRRWLADDVNALALVAASALAVALTTALWHVLRPDPAPRPLLALLNSCRIAPSADHQHPAAQPPPEHKENKSARSKERRRRGKDPFRDLFKGGKKSRALLKAIKAVDHHDRPAPSVDAPANASEPANDTASSTSRSPSPEPAGLDLLTPAMCAGVAAPNSITSVSAVSGDTSDHSSSDASSHPDPVNTANDTVVEHVSEAAPSSPPISAVVRTPQQRDAQAVSTSRNCTNLVRARTRLRMAKIESGAKPHALSVTAANSLSSIPVATCPSLFISSSSHSIDGAGPSTPTNSRGSTPPRSRSLENLERRTESLDQDAVSAQTQLASMHGALEAAHAREQQLRAEAEQASKERDELRWRWNEDAGVWQRREAELQGQIHHLIQRLQTYAAVASFQAQQASSLPSSGFSSPTSPHVPLHPLAPFPLPPAIQAQNSASPPAHVQALLASAPMLTSHPPGYAAPVPGTLYPGTMSPLWSGMGLCVPSRDPRHGGRRTPDSSASGSSSRGRRRRRRPEDVKSASDESSSLGEWDGSGDDGGCEEEEEDIFSNNALADAILKRPDSIRRLGRGRPGNGTGAGAGERKDALKDPALEDPSPQQ